MRKAVKYCVEHDILKEFLEANASEVENMLLMEWNWDDARSVWREEGLEEGLAKGREEGLEEGMAKGMAKGVEKRDVELLAMIDAGCGLEELRERLAAQSGAGLQA